MSAAPDGPAARTEVIPLPHGLAAVLVLRSPERRRPARPTMSPPTEAEQRAHRRARRRRAASGTSA